MSDLNDSGLDESPMVFPEGPLTPSGPWRHAVYKLAGKGKLPAWEVSWQRFQKKGETLMHIAQNQEGGKGGILPKTVMGHVMTALSQGRSVDLKVQGSVSIIVQKKRK